MAVEKLNGRLLCLTNSKRELIIEIEDLSLLEKRKENGWVDYILTYSRGDSICTFSLDNEEDYGKLKKIFIESRDNITTKLTSTSTSL